VGGKDFLVAGRRQTLTPGGFDDLDVEPVALAHVNPAVAEHSVARRQHPVAGRKRVAQCGFPAAGPGGRVDEDMRPFRFQHLAHILETRVQDLGEGRRAVVNRRNVAGLAGLLRHVRGPGDEHGVLIAHCQPPTIVARSVCPAPARRHYFEIVFQNSMDWNNPYLSVTYIFHSMNLSFRFAQRHLMKNQEDRGLSARRARGRPRDWNDNTDQNMIKSLDRAMSVFEYISQARGKNLSSIADELGQSPATIYRILVTLESKGLVEFDGDAQLWHIGPRAFVI